MWRFTPDELEAIRLSLKVALWATFGSLPLGLLVAYALARWRFPGKLLLDGLVHLPLVMPPVVTGYLLLLTFGRRGPLGAPAGRVSRHRVLVPLDRCRARQRRDGLPAAGARRPAVVRGGRPAARGGGRDAGRLAAVGVRHRDPAAGAARRHRRHGAGLRQGAGRVRRHDHLRLQHPGRDPDPALGDLHLHPGPRRRSPAPCA